MFQLSSEQPEDEPAVEALFDTAFGSSRFSLPSYQFRDGIEPVSELNSVVRDECGTILGAIRFWPVDVGSRKIRTLLLGPVAVHPIMQGEGVGSGLIQTSIDNAAELGWKAIILVGDKPYYERFGFRRIDTIVFPPPTSPERVLCLEMAPGHIEDLVGKVCKASS